MDRKVVGRHLLQKMVSRCSSKEKKRSSTVSDRLSSLPDELLDTILKYLPPRNVVRTSALSKFWRYRWMSIPDFAFHAPSTEAQRNTEPVDFVLHLFSLHNAPSAPSEIANYLDCPCPDFDSWTLFLIRKQEFQFSAGCSLSETFSSLKHAALVLKFQDSLEISTTVCLLKSLPCLQTLSILSYSNTQLMYVDKDEDSWETTLFQEKALFPMLTTVRIINFKGTHQEFRLVKFILRTAPLLDTIHLDFDPNIYDHRDELVPLLHVLLRFCFCRVSHRARVQVHAL